LTCAVRGDYRTRPDRLELAIEFRRPVVASLPAAYELATELRVVVGSSRYKSLGEMGASLKPARTRQRLAELTAGTRIPDLEELRSIVRACKPAELERMEWLRHAAIVERNKPSTNLSVAQDGEPSTTGRSQEAGSDRRPGRLSWLGQLRTGASSSTSRALGFASVAAVLVLLVVAVLVIGSRNQEMAVADGSDPKSAGCDADAETADEVDVYLPGQYLAGKLELRTSGHCGSSWGKFMPSGGLPSTPALNITITARRPADAGSTEFHIDYAGQNVYGNQLASRYECVYVDIQMIRDSQKAPVVSTKCVRSG